MSSTSCTSWSLQIPDGHSRDEFDMILPPQGQSPTVTSVAVTRHFIVTSSKQGIIAYYLAKVRLLGLRCEMEPSVHASKVHFGPFLGLLTGE